MIHMNFARGLRASSLSQSLCVFATVASRGSVPDPSNHLQPLGTTRLGVRMDLTIRNSTTFLLLHPFQESERIKDHSAVHYKAFLIGFVFCTCLGFPVDSDGKETAFNSGDPGWISGSGRSPGEGNGTHSSTLAWKIPWTEEPGRLQSIGLLKSDMTERRHFLFSLSHIGEGNGNPLPCSCLENPRDGGAWWAAIYGVAQGRTRLKWLGSSSSSNWHSGRVFVFYCFCVPQFGCLTHPTWGSSSEDCPRATGVPLHADGQECLGTSLSQALNQQRVRKCTRPGPLDNSRRNWCSRTPLPIRVKPILWAFCLRLHFYLLLSLSITWEHFLNKSLIDKSFFQHMPRRP